MPASLPALVPSTRYLRHAFQTVGTGHLIGAAELAVHVEGVEGFPEFLARHALGGKEFRQAGLVVQVLAVAVDGLEQRLVHVFAELQLLHGVVGATEHRPALVEDGRHTDEFHRCRLFLAPRGDMRFGVVAMRAAVPEELDHLDLGRVARGLRLGQFHPGFGPGAERGQQQGKQAGEQRQAHGRPPGAWLQCRPETYCDTASISALLMRAAMSRMMLLMSVLRSPLAYRPSCLVMYSGC